MKKSSPPVIQRISAAKQRRLDELLDKNSEGTITPKEKAKLEELVADAERLMVANAKRLAAFTAGESRQQRRRAVPVTVWVQAETAGR